MGKLFILKESPWVRNDMLSILKLSREGDAVLFVQNAVFVLDNAPEDFAKEMENKKSLGVKLYALKADLDARGIKTNLEVVDFHSL
ncbi:MAG TPA: sulfurtransferase complex subunit TusB [Candidatus Altiarchaeales archaeon]|nr:sulfurtransferase complex subunit TusB [Candidatus Altiarchaeales archaeon]